MAFTLTSPDPRASDDKSGLLVLSESYTLPSSATTEYSSVIKHFHPNLRNNNRYVTFTFNASAVSGTNLDIALYGSADEAGTSKYLLLDAVVADITATGIVAGVVDLNAYPAPFYFVAWTSDQSESDNSIAVTVEGVPG